MLITKRTNIAIQILMYCAANNADQVTKSEISCYFNASEKQLKQVIHQLSQLGFIHAQPGRNGDITLRRPAKEIRIGEVLRRLDASDALVKDFSDVDNAHPQFNGEHLIMALADASEALYRHLDEITLEALVSDNDELLWILTPFHSDE